MKQLTKYYDVTELSTIELRNINGGGSGWKLLGKIIGGIAEVAVTLFEIAEENNLNMVANDAGIAYK